MALALTGSQEATTATQSDRDVLSAGPPEPDRGEQIVATNFATIAAANGYWR